MNIEFQTIKDLFCGLEGGGETGIRTLEGLASLPVFKTGAFDHSAISPSSEFDLDNSAFN